MSQRRPVIPRPALVLITDSARIRNRPHDGNEILDDIVRDAVLGGVNLVQLREKHLATPQLIDLGLHVRDAITDRALFFVNGDLDAARTLRADGIHLSADGPTPREARDRLGDHALVSVAVHSLAAAISAEREGADMLVFGTVFPSTSHPAGPVAGSDALREVCAAVTVPVIAIGGITAANAPDCMAAGAAGVAVISAIHDAPNPREAAATLRAAIRPAIPNDQRPTPTPP